MKTMLVICLLLGIFLISVGIFDLDIMRNEDGRPSNTEYIIVGIVIIVLGGGNCLGYILKGPPWWDGMN